MRLVDGEPCSGRVQVYRGHQWGELCKRGWGLREANVVCRELGCGWATPGLPLEALFAGGAGPAWLADIQCSGEEDTLARCQVRGVWRTVGDGRCPHSSTAGAECSGRSAGVRERPRGWGVSCLSIISSQATK